MKRQPNDGKQDVSDRTVRTGVVMSFRPCIMMGIGLSDDETLGPEDQDVEPVIFREGVE
jgi:hypothetical protein